MFYVAPRGREIEGLLLPKECVNSIDDFWPVLLSRFWRSGNSEYSWNANILIIHFFFRFPFFLHSTNGMVWCLAVTGRDS